MTARYHAEAGPLRYAPSYIQTAALGLVSVALGAIFAILAIVLALRGGDGWVAAWNAGLSHAVGKASGFAFSVALVLLLATVALYRKTPRREKIASLVRYGLFDPAHGNPLHLRDGELLPRITCKRLGQGRYKLTVSAHESVEAETIAKAAPVISSTLSRRFAGYAVTVSDVDVAFNAVVFTLEDVTIDRSLTFCSAEEMRPESVTQLRVDQVNAIDLTTSGSMLVAGKTRSGKTTGVISLLLQVLQHGPDEWESQVLIIDPKRAELSRLPHTVTLDEDGEGRKIIHALEKFEYTIRNRQRYLNDLSEQSGDAVHWWDAGLHPSFLFIDEYVAARSIFPKKAPAGSDYCLETFDNLVKRIVTMGASAGCFVILSIAEASVQEGGLPAMLRSAMSTKALFRPTQPEGRLIWDKEKLETFPEGRVYGPGDAWFSSTDGVHDTVTFAHFPHLNFPAYRALGRLMRSYHSC